MHRFHVPDMTCSHCVQKVDKALKGVDTQAAVTIDLPTKSVEVNSATEAPPFLDAIKAAGFTPSAR